MARLFVAVRPPLETLDLLAAEVAAARPSGRWVDREQWHVTVCFLHDGDERTVATALETLQAPVAPAVLGDAAVRLGRRVLAVPVAGLDELAAAVTAVLDGAGVGPDEDRTFHGHLTVARGTRRGGLPPLTFSETYLGSPARHFVAREVELVRSDLSRDGARHTVASTVPLVGAVA